MDFNGKHALVTGGAIRAGAFICRELAARGAVVTIHCRTSGDAARALLPELPGTGHRVIEADFAVPDEAERLFAAAGKVDILVNNASVYRLPGSDAGTAPVYRQVNLYAPLKLMELFAGQSGMTAGVIINILDQEVLTPERPDEPPYLVSRRALAAATLKAARELAPRNIRVNAVAPGPMIPPKGLENSKMQITLQSVPLGRKVEPADFARAVAFLAECGSITGAILPVDCGQHL